MQTVAEPVVDSLLAAPPGLKLRPRFALLDQRLRLAPLHTPGQILRAQAGNAGFRSLNPWNQRLLPAIGGVLFLEAGQPIR